MRLQSFEPMCTGIRRPVDRPLPILPDTHKGRASPASAHPISVKFPYPAGHKVAAFGPASGPHYLQHYCDKRVYFGWSGRLFCCMSGTLLAL